MRKEEIINLMVSWGTKSFRLMKGNLTQSLMKQPTESLMQFE